MNMSDQSMASGSAQIKNIVLVGRAGNGKSATGNSLIRQQRFTSVTQATGVTMTCQTFRAVTKSGPIINVIDTPGLFDLITTPAFISKEIVRCLALVEEGLHAVVLVLSARNRITQEEESVVSTLQSLFGSRILDYLIVVFSGGDELEENNQTLKTYLSTSPEFLTRIFTLSGNRKVLFNNKTKDEKKKDKQIEELLAHVAAIGRKNEGRPFTEEMHRQIKEETKKLTDEEKKAEARYRKEAEKEREKKEELRMSFQLKMDEMAMMVERKVVNALDMHEAMMRIMENMATRREQDPKPSCNIM
ncbi:PREDICTED: immune-associated nucleotide-binding protein 8-like isoform X1 [Camelina sativa]|uniref:Immune-associated nucleotide-binding protein 8-like isoform X1 n=2 Tax=Camelina sativa TaxID=90675 RepID=A0ABM1R6T9_CAMSA|nr:PREDICTED: immune-associated nucleotide-binding protein 8-like isoform X1 [Camelina sativa]